VAADRRLLVGERAALGGQVLVAGDPAATRLALPGARLDVLGAQPYDRTVTVLSDGLDAGALPAARWSGVVVVDPPAGTADRMVDAARSACRPGGTVVVIEPAATGRLRRARRLRRYPAR
jgi:hypothetical protein